VFIYEVIDQLTLCSWNSSLKYTSVLLLAYTGSI
jgi:hypothetical protein